ERADISRSVADAPKPVCQLILKIFSTRRTEWGPVGSTDTRTAIGQSKVFRGWISESGGPGAHRSSQRAGVGVGLYPIANSSDHSGGRIFYQHWGPGAVNDVVGNFCRHASTVCVGYMHQRSICIHADKRVVEHPQRERQVRKSGVVIKSHNLRVISWQIILHKN